MQNIIKLFLFACLLSSSLSIAAISTDAPSVTNPEKTIIVDKENQEFTIILASTPSTGFSWLLESYDINLVKPIKHDYNAPAKTALGAAGVERWVFAASPEIIAGPQVTTITLIQARMWDIKNTTSKKSVFTVVIN
ncbi:MAG: protease inhibitor I42 family protein [Gammaproteobacteria bacterium]|nr:protease inhibitor I42 family protein [Gammaproteobacteria bacterium]